MHTLESQHLTVEAAQTERGKETGDEAGGDGLSIPSLKMPAAAALEATPQMSLFRTAAVPDPLAEALKAKLEGIDPNRMTPIEAMLKLAELKALIEADV